MSLRADDTGAAILRSNGDVLLNQSAAPISSALFPGDTVQAQTNASARIELGGSSVEIKAETAIEFESSEIHLDHGSVTVYTARGFKVRVGCLLVTPANIKPTVYNVTDTDGKVTVAALKDDVNIDSRSANPRDAKQSPGSGRVSVHEGEQKSRAEKCGAYAPKSASKAATDGILNSPYVRWPAVAVAGGIICRVLCQDDDPVSPSKP